MKFKIPKFLKGTDYTDKKNLQINTEVMGNKHELRTTNTVFDLYWVDEFISKIKPYIYVRKLDRLLILIPNQAYKLNESGVTMLDFLLNGHSISEFLSHVENSEDKRRDIHHFFCDLRATVNNCLCEHEKREAVTYYEFESGFNEYPVLSEVALTYRCNLQCEFCYVGDRSYGELNTNDTKKILFKIYHEAKVPSVSFTGGEPLVRNDICALVEYASNVGLWTNLITNATLLTRETVHNLKRAGLSSTQVSIEGPNARVHDTITGITGSFNMTVQGLKLLLDEGIPVHTNTTVSKNNIAHLEEILLLAKNVGLSRLSMNLLIPCGSAFHKQHLWVSYSDIGDYIMRLKRRATEEHMKFLWYSPVPMCTFNPIAYGFGNKSCAAITGLLSIDPLGNIIPCSSWRMPVGSLLKQRFENIWQSAMLNYFKNSEYAPATCHECLSFDVCKGACPLYWKARGEGELGART